MKPLPGPRQGDERGATMVEAAIGGLVFFTIFFLVFQCALLARANLGSDYGSTSGARAGAVAANDPTADADILAGVARGAIAGGKKDVLKVVVFKATDPGTPVPPACLTGPVTGLCNVYSGADLDRPATDFGTGNWLGDDSWSPLTRGTSRSSGPDFLGVHVEMATGAVTPLPSRLSGSYIAQLEATRD